jgi:hypothetical protein
LYWVKDILNYSFYNELAVSKQNDGLKPANAMFWLTSGFPKGMALPKPGVKNE